MIDFEWQREFLFQDNISWRLNDNHSLFVSIPETDSGTSLEFRIDPEAHTATLTIKSNVFEYNIKMKGSEALTILSRIRCDEPDGSELYLKYHQFKSILKKMWPDLSFIGEIWVNPIFYHGGGVSIERGLKMTWMSFLEAYKDLSLWDLSSVNSSHGRFRRYGAYVRLAEGNRSKQPVTSRQVVITEKGFWGIREGNLLKGEFRGLVRELEDVNLAE